MTTAAPGLMVCGTTSNAGKTTIVAGLCRVLADHGLRVAPFKAQNMALNSAVTATGHEIGRAQYLQAQAAGVEPEVAMNPILLKPTGERASQVVVNGKPIGVMSAAEYHQAKPELFAMVCDTLADIRQRYDAVIVEGAGSPAEINLLPHDIVNLRLAHAADIPAVVVGDIDPGGVFAALAGTVSVLPPELASLIRAFIINKLRGDPALLFDGTDQLETITGVPTIGVIPMLDDLRLDAEDSLALNATIPNPVSASLDVAVVRFPRISNFTDIDPLHHEPDVAVRFITSVRELGRPDLIVLPGTKATVDDLAWLRQRGLDQAITDSDATVLGICGGYQMLGTTIDDKVESGEGAVTGLGLLPVATSFHHDKVLAQHHGTALGHPVIGYQIHHGRVRPVASPTSDCASGGTLRGVADAAEQARPDNAPAGAAPASSAPTNPASTEAWLTLGGADEGFRCGRVLGTTLHGVLDNDGLRGELLTLVAARAGQTIALAPEPFESVRQSNFAKLASGLTDHVDLERLWSLMGLTVPAAERAAAAPDATASSAGPASAPSAHSAPSSSNQLVDSPDSGSLSLVSQTRTPTPTPPSPKVAPQP